VTETTHVADTKLKISTAQFLMKKGIRFCKLIFMIPLTFSPRENGTKAGGFQG
jgi:hypothetical protein